ncbi:dTMP kinase [Acetobacteraceae bacterium KSS8]|uniref:Thymidylate kinase n=1 Tax=Endosaccharibacter trunci TaxID=2812733 RepID=A0ABT1W723_9PROT|nr:dTMP kinase [Acetobacteraceae bacterium KSS8]
MSGFFLTLEGGEGAGKSTQSRLLAEELERGGHRVLRTREPGGSPGAERLRALLLAGDHGLCLRSEILLHVAARMDHLERTVLPALAGNAVVVCDRFGDSTLAYQGYGLAEGDPEVLDFIRAIARASYRQPDLTLLLDVSREVARTRLVRRGDSPDRYERLDEAFHDRVSAGFRAIAEAEPERVVRIDADGAPELVSGRLLREVKRRLGS